VALPHRLWVAQRGGRRLEGLSQPLWHAVQQGIPDFAELATNQDMRLLTVARVKSGMYMSHAFTWELVQ